MSRKSPDLSLSQPRCRNCKRLWRPAPGVVADKSYCSKCSKERRAIAAMHFGLRPLTDVE